MRMLQAAWNNLLWTVWNSGEARARAVPRIVLQFVLLAIVTKLAQIAIGGENSDVLSVAFTLRLVAVLFSTWLAGRFIDRRRYREFGLRMDAHWWADLGFGLVLGAALMTLIFTFEYTLGWLTVSDKLVASGEGPSFGIAILGPLVVFIAVGISEEILSRGYQLRNMAEGFNFGHRSASAALLAAWLLSSVLFGLYHALNPNATWVSTANLVLAGLFLGLGLVLTGRLGLPIGLHISWNFFQGNVFGFPVSGNDYATATFIAIRQGGPNLWTGGAFGPEAGLIGIAAIVTGSILIVLWVRMRYGALDLYKSYAVYVPRHAQEYYAQQTRPTDA